MSVSVFPHWQGAAQVADPVLDSGAVGIDHSSGAIKIGDGTTAFSALASINTTTPAGAVTEVAAPGSAVATGIVGQIAFDATHIYVCIATNTWVRATLATW